jgi:TetR/AcrR family transcriptional regulator
MEFAEFGYKGASIMNIAKRANLPRANVHYYFNSKLELYKKVLFDILKLWNDPFNQITPEDDPADAIGACIEAKVLYSKTNPLASKIFANEIIHGAPRISEYLNSDFREWLQSKSTVIEQWIKQGKMDAVDPLFLIMLIWSATQHYADFSTQVSAVLNKPQLSDKDFDHVADSIQDLPLLLLQIKYILNKQRTD